MKMSPFFSDLSSTYAYEIEDLTYDSAGDNVLASRLQVKREKFADLLPMIESFPVMVVPAFRSAFRFGEKALPERLIAGGPDDFPSWEALSKVVEVEPWAQMLAQRSLEAPGGEKFMLIAAGLEYIFGGHAATTGVPAEEIEGAAQEGAGEGDEEDPGDDLAEAGEDYLSEQGFDRRN